MNRFRVSVLVFGLLALISGLRFVVGPSVYAQPPADGTPPQSHSILPDELNEPIPPEAEPHAAKMIERVLGGDSSQDAPGVLGDVLDVIRRQGSVLDGSVLDQPEEFLSEKELNPNRSAASLSETQNKTQTVQAAEALLRTARMLEALAARSNPATDPSFDTRELVEQMRVQATRLLLNEFPQAAASRLDMKK